MKKVLVTLVLLMSVVRLEAQILQPVKWSYAAKKTSSLEAIISFKAELDEGWHMYSQHVEDGGPTKTVFKFMPSSQYLLIGGTRESKSIQKFEKLFGMSVRYFEREAVFQQKIKLKSAKSIMIKGTISFGACNDSTCIPPEEINFNLTVR